MVNKINFPLLIGTTIILLVIIIVCFADQIATTNPYTIDLGGFEVENGESTFFKPPYSPSEKHIFGTDILGRDIFSRLIYGAKTTLTIILIATLLKFIVAIPIALVAGFGNRSFSMIIKHFSNIFSAIPALIVSILILNLRFIKNLDIEQAIIAFAIVFVFVEWGRLGKILEDNIKNILNMNFIQGEIAIGKNKIQVALQNVLPHLIPIIIIHFFMEMGRSLLLIAQLGVFGVYAGKNKIDPVTIKELRLNIFPEFYPEWGGMLSTARYAIQVKKPWIILYTASFITITLVGLNLLGEGIKIEVTKRKSMVLTYARRFVYHLSPLNFLYEIKHYKKYKLNISIKASIVAFLVILALLPTPDSLYKLDAQEVFSNVEEFSNDKYEGRLVGSRGRNEAAQYIVNQLKSVNLEPLFNGSYTQEFDTTKSINNVADIKNLDFYVTDENNSTLANFKFRQDYYTNIFLSKEKLSGKIITYEQYKNKDYNIDDQYYVLFDEVLDKEPLLKVGSADDQLELTLLGIGREKFVAGVIVTLANFDGEDKDIQKIEDYEYHIAAKDNTDYHLWFGNPFVIYVNQDTANRLNQNVNRQLVFDSHFNENSGTGINIGGMIKGATDESVVIVTNYDYLGYDMEMNYKGLLYNSTSIATNLEIIKKLSNSEIMPEKNIIFLFLDSSKISSLGANSYLEYENNMLNEESFVIMMNYLGYHEDNVLYYDDSHILGANKTFYQYVQYLKSRSGDLGVIPKNEILIKTDYDCSRFVKESKASILYLQSINNNQYNRFVNTKQDDFKIIDMKQLENQGQLILDILTYIAY